MCDPEDMITTERVAVVVERLVLGEPLSYEEVCELTGITRQGAGQMLAKLSRVLPLAQAGRWWLYVRE